MSPVSLNNFQTISSILSPFLFWEEIDFLILDLRPLVQVPKDIFLYHATIR